MDDGRFELCFFLWNVNYLGLPNLFSPYRRWYLTKFRLNYITKWKKKRSFFGETWFTCWFLFGNVRSWDEKLIFCGLITFEEWKKGGAAQGQKSDGDGRQTGYRWLRSLKEDCSVNLRLFYRQSKWFHVNCFSKIESFKLNSVDNKLTCIK
jgi:hypothetical protein